MTNIFDDVSSISIGNEEVASIELDGGTIWEKKKDEPLSDVLTLTVDVSESIIEERDGWTTICDTDNYSGTLTITDNECDVDWGDGSQLQHYTDTDGDYFVMGHNYSNEGTYTVKVYGEILDIGSLIADARTIVIPSTVTNLSSTGVNWLNEITFISSTPPTMESGLKDSIEYRANEKYNTHGDNLIIRVPTGSLSAYQNATNYPSTHITYVEY